jgi:hypothetical protein
MPTVNDTDLKEIKDLITTQAGQLTKINETLTEINGSAASYGVLKFNFFDFSYAPRGGELTRD